MGYLVLLICAVYAALWAAGLLFSLRSDGQKAIWIPALGLLLFLGGTAQSALYVQAAMQNPPRLNEANYTRIQLGMTPDEVSALLGTPQPDDREFNLQEFSLVTPREVSGRLRGARQADARDARLIIKISGEPSEANLRKGEGLGAPATYERGGLMGLDLMLVENGNEVHFIEGTDWNYEDNMTAEDVAKKLGELIDAHPSWVAVGSPEEDPNAIIITPELEDNKGSACNEVCAGRVVSSETITEGEGDKAQQKPVATNAVKVRGVVDGSQQKFVGGEDEALVKYWFEDGVLMDADFSTGDRLVIGGFIDNKLVGIVQSGIALPAPTADATTDAAE